MERQQFPGGGHRLPDPLGQPVRPHAVLGGQRTCLEQRPLRPVGGLRAIGRDCSSLLPKRQIRVSRAVGFDHGSIPRQRRRYAELLLFEVHVGHRHPGGRLNQTP